MLIHIPDEFCIISTEKGTLYIIISLKSEGDFFKALKVLTDTKRLTESQLFKFIEREQCEEINISFIDVYLDHNYDKYLPYMNQLVEALLDLKINNFYYRFGFSNLSALIRRLCIELHKHYLAIQVCFPVKLYSTSIVITRPRFKDSKIQGAIDKFHRGHSKFTMKIPKSILRPDLIDYNLEMIQTMHDKHDAFIKYIVNFLYWTFVKELKLHKDVSAIIIGKFYRDIRFLLID